MLIKKREEKKGKKKKEKKKLRMWRPHTMSGWIDRHTSLGLLCPQLVICQERKWTLAQAEDEICSSGCDPVSLRWHTLGT